MNQLLLMDELLPSPFQLFFEEHPWLLTTFKISPTASLEHVLYYVRDIADVRIMTSDLAGAGSISSQPIAQGGLADVYRATLADGLQVAVKLLRERPQGDNKELKRTARELNAWSKLDHPNILTLLGLAEFHGKLSMISPWMEHGNVVSALQKRSDLDRYHLCAQLVNAVAYLHDEDVVHGDIKGVNVLLDGSDQVKLTDFGLAIIQEQYMQFSETDPGGGTIRWMAPELFTEDGVRSMGTDVYALGMTMMASLSEILTGRIPFSEIQAGHLVIKAVFQDKRIPEVPELRAETSGRANIMLDTLIRCWTYRPNRRATANEVQQLMGRILEDEAHSSTVYGGWDFWSLLGF
ncbi:kinase-like protein [Ceratobasidium sp. AG-I]|nr:kinase-like protein [Ceratobasidium sp. AG-I]